MRHGFQGIRVLMLLALLVAAGGVFPAASADKARARRLDALQEEMKRLQNEMTGLAVRERGLLGEVARMDAELALRRAELEDVSLRLRDTEDRLRAGTRELARINDGQERRAPKLAARMREIYKRGSAGMLARLVAPFQNTDALDGLRYATYLSRRDAVQLAAWRAGVRLLADEQSRLSVEQARLSALSEKATQKDAALRSGRAARASLLARIQGDRKQHEQAFGELEEAARRLGRLVDSFEGEPAHVALNVRTFRGLLDWPADGAVSAPFGTLVHPRFKTEVPHPGWDIEADQGQPFRSIFDGRVAYAAPLAGYGLTVVLDHGHGVVSIYAHAAVLLVAAGQDVTRGQEVGRVGDSGSLRGPYLYFEIRDGGKPVDPSPWLRRR
jgi:septal ring factor EnvC (AmiA/AmiB activator)